MEAIKAARKDPSSKFVVVIEEINRGNPAQIFGELLTLLEAGKRTPSEALELCYPDADGVRRPVHIPENSVCNWHDEHCRPFAGSGGFGAAPSLCIRRTGAKSWASVWRDWVVKTCGVDEALVTEIEQRVADLNERIASDARLGKQFRIGHSYVTPVHRLEFWRYQKMVQAGGGYGDRSAAGRILV